MALWQCGPSEAELQLCSVVSDAVGMLRRVRPERRLYTVKSVVNLERPVVMEYLGWKESGLQGG